MVAFFEAWEEELNELSVKTNHFVPHFGSVFMKIVKTASI